MLGIETRFPYVLGSEGAGVVTAVGANVTRFSIGDRVFAQGFLNPKGGFYAQFVAVEADYVSLTPASLTTAQASVISGVGMTALRGLVDILELKFGESLAIFGASGGIGHVAVQLAKQLGARVFAVASGEDGVAMIKQLGIDCVANGRQDNLLAVARSFGFDSFDVGLLTAGGKMAEQIVSHVRVGGRVAFPYGINPEPQARSAVKISGYHGDPDPDIIQRLNAFIASETLTAHVDKTFPLERVVEAHRYINQHYLGKLALQVRPPSA